MGAEGIRTEGQIVPREKERLVQRIRRPGDRAAVGGQTGLVQFRNHRCQPEGIPGRMSARRGEEILHRDGQRPLAQEGQEIVQGEQGWRIRRYPREGGVPVPAAVLPGSESDRAGVEDHPQEEDAQQVLQIPRGAQGCSGRVLR